MNYDIITDVPGRKVILSVASSFAVTRFYVSIWNIKMATKDKIGRSVIASFVAALGSISFGYCMAYSSSASVDLTSSDTHSAVRLTGVQGSWFSSLVAVGAVFGCPIGGWAIDKFGRKRTLLFCSVPFELGWLLISFAQNRAMLYAGRITTGLACGIVSVAAPVYIAEIAHPRTRGMLGSISTLAIVTGLVMSFVAGVFCHWKLLALIGGVPPALLVIFLYFMPETPIWLLRKKHRKEALDSLVWLRGSNIDTDIEKEGLKVAVIIGHEEKLSLPDWLSPVITKPLMISIGLMIFQQLSGITAVVFNAASIFAIAGFTDSKLVSISVGLVQFLGTSLTCSVIDKTGRRVLLLTMSIAISCTLFGLGAYFEICIPPMGANSSSHVASLLGTISHSVPASTINWFAIVCIVLFNLFFAFAWGPVPWLVMSEIFPPRARGPCSSLATIANWLAVFIVTKTYNTMQTSMSIQGTYWFFGGCSMLGFIFVYMVMPETKGKTLTEIEAIFDQRQIGMSDKPISIQDSLTNYKSID